MGQAKRRGTFEERKAKAPPRESKEPTVRKPPIHNFDMNERIAVAMALLNRKKTPKKEEGTDVGQAPSEVGGG